MAPERENILSETILLADVFVVGHRRMPSDAAVEAMKASISRIGLRTPITVRYDASIVDPETGEVIGGYAIIAGLHRVTACRALGWERIPAIIRDCDEVDAELWEIAENLHRAELTALERDEQVARWIELTDSKSISAQVAPKLGRPEGGINAASRELGIERTAAQRAVKVAALSDEAKEAARSAGLDDNRSALLEAAKAPKDQQANIVRTIADQKDAARNRIDRDVKARAAREVAEMLSEHVPGEWWDALKSNLYAAGAANIAHEFTNITGQSIMDRRYG